MRLAPGLVLLGLVALLVAAAAPAPVPRPFGLAASAPTAGIEIASDRSVAGRTDRMNFTVWLNVTGNGQFQRTLLNVTFNTQADPRDNAISQGPPPLAWTQPSGCVYDVASGWFLAWHCDGLRAGTYVWGIPAYVPDNATVGHYQRVEASTFSTVGGGNVSASANVSD